VWPQVMCKLGQGEVFYPVILILLANPMSEVLFYPCVLSLCLSIGLWVEGCADILLNPHLITHFSREGADC